MYLKLALFLAAMLVDLASSLSPKQCDDCIPLSQCTVAANLVKNDKSNKTIYRAMKSVCSVKKSNNVVIEANVCCSDFSETEDEIENHKNRKLLPDDCGIISGKKVIAGTDAGRHEFPWMVVLLGKNNKVRCGGTLINKQYILTAGHCLNSIKSDLKKVRLGEYILKNTTQCSNDKVPSCEHVDLEFSKKYVTAHPNYKEVPGKEYENDIALYRLPRPANFSYDNIKPICLPTHKVLRDKDISGQNLTVAGWGQKSNNEEYSNVLQKGSLLVSNYTICKNNYANIDNIICTGFHNTDSCNGDSGGPLFMKDDARNKDYKYFQYGIVSYGPDGCKGNTVGANTDVRPYLKWILDTIYP